VAFLRGLSTEELLQWAEENLHVYLDVNSADAALLGQLLRLGVPLSE
jgi:hypothetical protein